MPLTLQAAMWGVVAMLPLLLGAGMAIRRNPSPRIVGLIAAFGAGALISAVAFDLVLDASGKEAPRGALAAGLAAGTISYWLGVRAIGRRNKPGGGSGRGAALVLGAIMDGIPESFILGLSLAIGGAIEMPFLVAVAISNFPEGMAATAELRNDPAFGPARLLRTWAIVVIACGAVAGLGGLVGQTIPVQGVVAQGFAAGALLTMVTGDLVPEAERKVGAMTGLMAVLGFAVAFALHELGG